MEFSTLTALPENDSAWIFESNETVAEPPDWVRAPLGPIDIVFLTIWALVFVFGISGNTLVIYVILRYTKMQNSVTNYYILNLAVADELFILTMPLSMTFTIMRVWPFGDILCKLYTMVDAMNTFTSIYFLTVMSIDRYFCVVHAIKSQNYRTKKMAMLVCGCVWLLSMMVIWPSYVAAKVEIHEGIAQCVFDLKKYLGFKDYFWTLYTFVLGLVLPLIVIVICYLQLVLKLTTIGVSGSKGRKTKKVTIMVLAVISVFVICWAPYHILTMATTFSGNILTDATFYAMLTFLCLTYMNSCANPILYAFLSDNFRQSFRKACVCASELNFEASIGNFRRKLSKQYGKPQPGESSGNNNAGLLGARTPTPDRLLLHPTNGSANNTTSPVQSSSTDSKLTQITSYQTVV